MLHFRIDVLATRVDMPQNCILLGSVFWPHHHVFLDGVSSNLDCI